MALTFDQETGNYEAALIDEGCGSANIYYYEKDERSYLVSANREIDEIALYRIDEIAVE